MVVNFVKWSQIKSWDKKERRRRSIDLVNEAFNDFNSKSIFKLKKISNFTRFFSAKKNYLKGN